MGQFVGKYADIVGGGVLILIGTKDTFTTPWYYRRSLEVCIYMKVSETERIYGEFCLT